MVLFPSPDAIPFSHCSNTTTSHHSARLPTTLSNHPKCRQLASTMQILAIFTALIAAATVFVVVRLITRFWFVKSPGVDDCLVVAALVSSLSSLVCVYADGMSGSWPIGCFTLLPSLVRLLPTASIYMMDVYLTRNRTISRLGTHTYLSQRNRCRSPTQGLYPAPSYSHPIPIQFKQAS